MSKSERVTIRMPPQMREKIDTNIQKGYYKNRTEFIISAIRHSLMVWEKEHPEALKKEETNEP